MKKSITGVVALLAGAFIAHSQGTVSFGNYAALTGTGQAYIYVSLGTTKLGGSAAHSPSAATDTGDGADWTVALYGALGASAPASSLVQLDDASGNPVTATLETGAGADTTLGTWYSSAIGTLGPTTSGAGQAATVQVYAWWNDNGTYTTYAAAKAAGVPVGLSATGNISTGGPQTGAPPAFPAALPNSITSFTVAGGSSTIPEPSTIALGVMGASTFLLRLRKKQ
jgi:hypothetical protein